jgi:Gluconate 2-dehydrogenase subunit 3
MGAGRTPGGHARYPGYDVLGQAPTWDPVTKGVVLRRLGPTPPVRFFSVEEEAVARPMLERLLAQDEEPRIPVFEQIDARLAEQETDGWHYEDLPPDGEAWRASLAALESDARGRFGRGFAELGARQQKDLLEAVRTGERWHGLPAGRVWNLWIRYAVTAFYAHPWSWNEIGFGGPAYPRGYKNIDLDGLEPWEHHEAEPVDAEAWARRVEQAKRDHGA